MEESKRSKKSWENCRIGITGASGSLGRALIQRFREKGAFVIGLTHRQISSLEVSAIEPQEWVQWNCGEEIVLKDTLKTLDVLILNHGINPKGLQSQKALNDALEINALSSWRLMEIFENICLNQNPTSSRQRELWVNTSEAEIQPALSPAYEISKRLIGELVSLRSNNLDKMQSKFLIIRKLILGPFRSELNPIGIMSAKFVANQILKQAEFKIRLIIITPNPITYIIMPITELIRKIYSGLFRQETST